MYICLEWFGVVTRKRKKRKKQYTYTISFQCLQYIKKGVNQEAKTFIMPPAPI